LYLFFNYIEKELFVFVISYHNKLPNTVFAQVLPRLTMKTQT